MKSGGGGAVGCVLLEGTEPTVLALGRSDRGCQVEGNIVTCVIVRALLDRRGGQWIMYLSFDIEYTYSLESAHS